MQLVSVAYASALPGYATFGTFSSAGDEGAASSPAPAEPVASSEWTIVYIHVTLTDFVLQKVQIRESTGRRAACVQHLVVLILTFLVSTTTTHCPLLLRVLNQ